MATRRELIEFVRFRLEQLGSQNQHHDFEHIARHIARNRIAFNILPATGPVAGSGDQGRDAETFRTYLLENPLKGSTFVGLVAEKPIAFACTIQQAGLLSKVRQDLQKITASGIPVASIHYFTVANVPSGDRHKLQAWARDEHAVHLEIHDGRYVAEAMTDPDLFWIASDYLAVPLEMFPEEPAASGLGWYADLLNAWKANPDRLPTTAHFEQIKRAIRHATYVPRLRLDLPFWLDRLRAFMVGDLWDDLQRRATYESLVATLHLKGTLEGLEPEVRRFFDVNYSELDIPDHRDAAVLVTFCAGAIPVHAASLTVDEVATWRNEITESVEKQLDARPSPSEDGQIRFIQGFLELVNSTRSPDSNSSAAVEKWKGILGTVRQAPLLPLETLIDEFTRLSRSKYFRNLAENSEFQDFVHQLDELLAMRTGGLAIAEKARRRASAHHDNDRLLLALAELRRARLAAYSYESLEIFLESLLYSSEILISLGLPYAGKYYAMAAAWISSRSGKPESETYQPDALLIAAHADLLLGNWAGALELSTLGAEALLHYVPDTDEVKVQSVAEQIGAQFQLIYSVAKSVEGELAHAIESTILNRYGASAGTSNIEEGLIFHSTTTLTLDEVVDLLEGESWGEPFDDLSVERTHTWQANGITWSVRWTNELSLNAAAEELLASMQILALHLAMRDAYIAPLAISLKVTLGDVRTPSVVPSSGVGRELQVVLPKTLAGDEQPVKHTALILGLAVQLANFASLLPDSRFEDLVRDFGSEQTALRDAYVVLPYRRLYREMTDGGHPVVPDGLSYKMPDVLRQVTASKRVHPDLEWMHSELNEFDEEEAKTRIARRYEKIPASIPHTIGRLQASHEFAEIVLSLREEGWKDWHLLLAIQNIALKYWLNRTGLLKDHTEFEVEDATSQIRAGLESGIWDANYPTAISEFTEYRLRLELYVVGFRSELASVGLEPWPHVDLSAIREFLARRMKFWELDVPHDQVFSPGLLPS